MAVEGQYYLIIRGHKVRNGYPSNPFRRLFGKNFHFVEERKILYAKNEKDARIEAEEIRKRILKNAEYAQITRMEIVKVLDELDPYSGKIVF